MFSFFNDVLGDLLWYSDACYNCQNAPRRTRFNCIISVSKILHYDQQQTIPCCNHLKCNRSEIFVEIDQIVFIRFDRIELLLQIKGVRYAA